MIWKRHAKEFNAQPPTWGFAGSPTVIGDTVFFNMAKHGVALDRKTGATIWKSTSSVSGYATPVPLQICWVPKKEHS